jgi:hypothetical protein
MQADFISAGDYGCGEDAANMELSFYGQVAGQGIL